ncbi:MAG: hypothetical protein CSA20_08490 [Deltaproteobacteria bacterium]|nr:MAG: hypothetical protein CSA20_08490 [Deltaproteobacteria bacterium]
MRRSRIVNIEGVGEVTVKEVSPMALYKAVTADNRVEALMAMVDECVSLDRARLESLYASELEQLIDGIREVNSSFFSLADKLGIAKPIMEVAAELTGSLPPLFVGLFREGMAEAPGITVGSSS